MGEQLFDVWAWGGLEAWDMNAPDGWRKGEEEKLPVEDCLDSSYGMLPLPDMVGMPDRSEKGWPNASQSFSTSACVKDTEQNHPWVSISASYG